jgi:deoxyadenosine/deoxycytidine kinase
MDLKKWAFEFQLVALSSRIMKIKQAIKSNPTAKLFVMERSPEDDRFIFAEMLHENGFISTDHLKLLDQYRKTYIEEYFEDLIFTI